MAQTFHASEQGNDHISLLVSDYDLPTLRERDTPLWIKYDTKPIWSAVKRQLGIGPTGAAIAVALYEANRMGRASVSYSRHKGYYSKARRHPLLTYRKVLRAVTELEEGNWILHFKQAPGTRGWQSSMIAKPEMIRVMEEVLANVLHLKIRQPAEVIILRDLDHSEMAVSPTQRVSRMQRRIRRINDAISTVNISTVTGVPLSAPLVRIFNTDPGLTRGGRLYARGASWQLLPKTQRLRMTLNTEPVAELDFAGLHPAMLYAEADVRPPSDCYHIDGWDRALVKLATLILINARSGQAAREWLVHNANFPTELSDVRHRRETAMGLIRDIMNVHQPIAAAFHKDAGARLMRKDSDLAIAILSDLIAQGVAALPVHDSFIVPVSQCEILEAAMRRAARELGLQDIVIKVATNHENP